MSAKEITLNSRAQERLKMGIDKLANAVKVTLGPKGRNVVTGITQPKNFVNS